MSYIRITISDRVRNAYHPKTGVGIVWQWLIDNFGMPGQQPSGFRWQWDTYNTFYFTSEADAAMFALKWV